VERGGLTSCRRRETLLLALPVLLVILIKAFLPLDPPLLCKARPVPLPLQRSATGGLRPRHRQVRSGSMDGHQLWVEMVRTNKKS
jgi:hypothetical protein